MSKSTPKKPNTPTQIELAPIESVTPYARNPRKIGADAVSAVAGSIKEFGFKSPIIVDKDRVIINGHTRLKAAQQLGLKEVPIVVASDLTPEQVRAYRIADNRSAEFSKWDEDFLKVELDDIGDIDLSFCNVDEMLVEIAGMEHEEQKNEDNAITEQNKKISDKFGLVPFTVFNAREGWWQDRKRAWISKGIKSEEGRGADAQDNGNHTNGVLMKSDSGNDPNFYNKKKEAEAKLGRILTTEEFQRDHYKGPESYESGTSIFDPVLCEIAYRWFCPPAGLVLDPFAGGSVRGIVASHTGRQYVGVELRQEQVDANRQQENIAIDPIPVWHCGDSMNIDKYCHDVKADLIIGCPPYADLEKYSDDPADLSNMKYEDFLASYREIIRKTCLLLKQDRFVFWVIGEVRGKKNNGAYVNFLGDTIKAFLDAGVSYYNEAVLVTAVGSLAMRISRQFIAGRKLGKTHQNILIFCKGDSKKATEACGIVDFAEITDQGEGEAK
jgi:DNA modification methylase